MESENKKIDDPNVEDSDSSSASSSSSNSSNSESIVIKTKN